MAQTSSISKYFAVTIGLMIVPTSAFVLSDRVMSGGMDGTLARFTERFGPDLLGGISPTATD